MFICDDKPDLIFLTEIIPKAQRLPIHPALLSVPDYTLFTNFDPSAACLGASGKRGICILVASHLQAIEASVTDRPLIEQLWLRLSTRKDGDLLLGCFYRSPSVDTACSVSQLELSFEEASRLQHSQLMIVGDFNLPLIDWDLCTSAAPDGHPSHSFIETTQNCFLYQHIRCPTRFRVGDSPSTLDLVFTDEEGMVKNLRYLPGLGSSDHVILRFDLVSFSHTKVDNRDEKTHINYKDLTVTLSDVDWTHLQDLSLENGYGFLKTKMFESIGACSTKRRPKPFKNLYIDRTAWKLKKKKQHPVVHLHKVS